MPKKNSVFLGSAENHPPKRDPRNHTPKGDCAERQNAGFLNLWGRRKNGVTDPVI